MARLKVEFAEAGTDPTRAKNHVRHNVGLWATVKENWLLFAGLLILILLAPKILGIQLFNDDAKTTVAPTPDVTPIPWDAGGDPFANWCLIGNTLIPPGQHKIGDGVRECKHGAWVQAGALGVSTP